MVLSTLEKRMENDSRRGAAFNGEVYGMPLRR